MTPPKGAEVAPSTAAFQEKTRTDEFAGVWCCRILPQREPSVAKPDATLTLPQS